jgi:hypothetical protein
MRSPRHVVDSRSCVRRCGHEWPAYARQWRRWWQRVRSPAVIVKQRNICTLCPWLGASATHNHCLRRCAQCSHSSFVFVRNHGHRCDSLPSLPLTLTHLPNTLDSRYSPACSLPNDLNGGGAGGGEWCMLHCHLALLYVFLRLLQNCIHDVTNVTCPVQLISATH